MSRKLKLYRQIPSDNHQDNMSFEVLPVERIHNMLASFHNFIRENTSIPSVLHHNLISSRMVDLLYPTI